MNTTLRPWRLILAALLVALPLAVGAGEPVEITILHVNDTHGHIMPGIDKTIDEKTPVGGAAYLAAMVETERARNPQGTLLLSGATCSRARPSRMCSAASRSSR